MKNIFSCVIIVLYFGTTLAALGLEIVDPVEGHPNQCFVKDSSVFYNINQSWQLKECGLGSCSSMNIKGKQRMIISYSGCGVVVAEPPCYVAENKGLNYPDCCPEVICPAFEETEQNGNGVEDNDDDEYSNFGDASSSVEQRRYYSQDDDDLYGYKTRGPSSAYRYY